MTASEAILNYAVRQGGIFRRKDLLQEIARQQTDIKASAVTLQINRLIASGSIRRIGHGEYELDNNGLPEFVYLPSEEEKILFMKLKQQFPLLGMCIWTPSVLASFMLHVPDIGYTFLDVEKDGMETVFHFLQEMELGRNILLSPSPTDCERYLTGSDAIVVRQLIGESPLTVVDGCIVPRIEKILVDVIGDNELFFASGSETYNIYEFAFERNRINKSKLLRYASRRNRKEKVEQIIQTIENDQSQ
ncbi:MAG: type IV toxin-antitoxin system AbiEi family antitoxin domain-containing protein [Prevotella sp.]|nr:type IV toxin-antitoxin system AbiEi family antitoxin domain-containing protein [Prevotella sp.]